MPRSVVWMARLRCCRIFIPRSCRANWLLACCSLLRRAQARELGDCISPGHVTHHQPRDTAPRVLKWSSDKTQDTNMENLNQNNVYESGNHTSYFLYFLLYWSRGSISIPKVQCSCHVDIRWLPRTHTSLTLVQRGWSTFFQPTKL